MDKSELYALQNVLDHYWVEAEKDYNLKILNDLLHKEKNKRGWTCGCNRCK